MDTFAVTLVLKSLWDSLIVQNNILYHYFPHINVKMSNKIRGYLKIIPKYEVFPRVMRCISDVILGEIVF